MLTTTSGIIGVIAVAVSALWAVISRFNANAAEKEAERKQALADAKKEQKEAQEKAVEESNESVALYKERLTALEKLRKEYLLIYDAKYSEEERDKLLAEWKSKLADAYAIEKNAIDKVNESRQAGLDLLDEERKSDIDKAYSQGLLAYLDAVKAINESQVFSDTGEATRRYMQRDKQGNYPGFVEALDTTSLSGTNVSSAGQAQVLQSIFNEILKGVESTDWADWFTRYFYANGDRNGTYTRIRYDDNYSNIAGENIFPENIQEFDLVFKGTTQEYISLLEQAQEKLLDLRRDNGKLTEDQEAALAWVNDELNAANSKLENANNVIKEFVPVLAEYTLNDLGINVRTLESEHDFADAILAVNNAMMQGNLTTEEATLVTDWLLDKMEGLTDAVGVAEAAEEAETDAIEENTEATEKAVSSKDKLTAARERAAAKVQEILPLLFNEKGELTALGQEALSTSSYLADLVQTEINLQNETNRANYAYMRAQLAALSTDAVKAAKAIMAAYIASSAMVSLKRYAIEHGATPDVMWALTLLTATTAVCTRCPPPSSSI